MRTCGVCAGPGRGLCRPDEPSHGSFSHLSASKLLPPRAPAPESLSLCGLMLTKFSKAGTFEPGRRGSSLSLEQNWSPRLLQPWTLSLDQLRVQAGRGRGWACAFPPAMFSTCCNAGRCSRGRSTAERDLETAGQQLRHLPSLQSHFASHGYSGLQRVGLFWPHCHHHIQVVWGEKSVTLPGVMRDPGLLPISL